jgi:hypothetical protein
MAPRLNSAPAKKSRRQPATGSRRDTPIVRPAEPRRSARLRANIRPVSIPQPARAKRKRPQDSEVKADDAKSVRPAKQPRKLPSPRLELSETNLRKFNGEEMDVAAIVASSDVTQDTVRSQRSSDTTACYRYKHLRAARIYIHINPPDGIQNAINAIVEAEPSKERRAELRAISQELHNGCTKAVKAAIGEDDYVQLFLIALTAMNHRSLCLRAKADWREELKPTIQSSLNLNFMDFNFMAGDQQHEVDDASTPPRKRQQLDCSPIKIPRPDISIGIQHTTLISALSSQNLDDIEGEEFLEELQNKMMRRKLGGSEEPMLISVPTQRASDLVFPFAVVEAKAYSTGKQVFEAENQAAVSGACGLKIQLCLDELAKDATTSSDILPSKNQPPLFFSICTQGPFHELWVHYTNVEHGVLKFNMALLKVCHGSLLNGVVDFIIAVDNMLRWGTGQFVESVVERLGKVARRAGAGT